MAAAEQRARVPAGAYGPPPRALLAALVLALGLAVFPAANAWHQARRWMRERAGKSVLQQRRQYARLPWFSPEFLEALRRVELVVPPDADLLLTPTHLLERSGKGRWYLYFNYYGYPRRVWVRSPKLASGTVVDYPLWLERSFERLDPKDPAARGELRHRPWPLSAAEQEELVERGIEWELRYPVTRFLEPELLELRHREEGGWVTVPLAGPRTPWPVFQRAGRQGGDE